MPLIKTAQHNHPTRLLDIKSQKNGLRCTVFLLNGDKYTGEWQDNKMHGDGIYEWKKSGAIFQGEWKFGKRDGYGTLIVPLPETKAYATKYCGGWKNGKKHGYGKYTYKTSEIYEGEWSEDCRSGRGRMSYENGDIYEGEWMKGTNHGQGVMLFANGNWFQGTWRDGKKNGNGKLYYSDKSQLYEGLWVDGVAKCGTLADVEGNEAQTPKKYPIPALHLVDMQLAIREAESAYLERIKPPLQDTQ